MWDRARGQGVGGALLCETHGGSDAIEIASTHGAWEKGAWGWKRRVWGKWKHAWREGWCVAGMKVGCGVCVAGGEICAEV